MQAWYVQVVWTTHPTVQASIHLAFNASIQRFNLVFESLEYNINRFYSETNSYTERASLIPRPLPPFTPEKQGYASDRKLGRQLGMLYDNIIERSILECSQLPAQLSVSYTLHTYAVSIALCIILLGAESRGLVPLPVQMQWCVVSEWDIVDACIQNHKMESYAMDSSCSVSRANHSFNEQLRMKTLWIRSTLYWVTYELFSCYNHGQYLSHSRDILRIDQTKKERIRKMALLPLQTWHLAVFREAFGQRYESCWS